jgi:hypothetical protein
VTPIFSFVVDDDPRFAYQAWHLARSLVEHCGGDTAVIHVQCTPDVDDRCRSLFRDLGYIVHEIPRFGDGRYCNKLAQLDNLRGLDFDCAVLLDTDTIVISDLRPFLSAFSIRGKIVDGANPPIATLDEIAAASGLRELPPRCTIDAGGGETYVGNCNGGFYSIPAVFCEQLSMQWQRWAKWLLANNESLARVGREQHVDQVSFWLALTHSGLPFEMAPSNVNYYTHFAGAHSFFDPERDIALLHYHNDGLNAQGLLDSCPGLTTVEKAAIARANEQIVRGSDERVFWDVR